MKKITVIILCLVLLLSLVGCGREKMPESNIKTVSKNGTVYTIDTEKCIIQDSQFTYSYSFGTKSKTIKYPDGQTYTWNESNGMITGTTSLDFDYSAHVDPLILLEVIEDAYHTNNKTTHENVGIGLILLIIGIVDAVWSEKIWFLNWGWRYKNVEPSELAIGVYRVGGIIAAVIGLILIIF